MSDNVTLPFTGTGTATPQVATDEIGGIHHQRMKVEWGTDGVATDVSLADPLPVQGTVSVNDGGGSITVDGAVTVSDGGGSLTVDGAISIGTGLPTGANTIGTVVVSSLTAGLPTGANTIGAITGTVGVSGTVAVTDNAGSLTVDNPALSVVGGGTEATAQRVTIANDSTGVLSVDDNGGSLTVDGTVGISGSVAVTGPLTDLQLRATAVPISIAATVPVSDAGGSLTVDDGGSSITVDGTVGISGTVPVSNGGTFATQESQLITDNAGFTDGTSKVFPSGFIYDEVAGTALTENDAAAARININRSQTNVLEDGTTRGRYATVTAANALKIDGSGVTQPVSGTVTVGNSTGASAVNIQDGGNSITVDGTVGISGTVPVSDGGGSLTVDGTVAVSAIAAGLPTGANTIGTVGISGTVPVSDGGGSLTVDGTVVVSALSAGLPTGANTIGTVVVSSLTGGLPTGANTIGAVVASGTVNVASLTAGLPTGANTIGAVTVSGTVAVTDNAGSLTVDNPALSVVGGGTEATAQRVTIANDSTGVLSVDDNGGSLTVDGSVSLAAAIPAGTNNIGDVDVLTMPGTAAEAAALPSVFLVVAGDDGTDTQPLQLDASGNLKVNIQAGAGSGGTAIADNAAFTVASTSLTPVGGTYKSTRHSVSDGSAGAFAMTPKRGLYTVLETPTGDSAMDDTNDAVRVNIVAGAGSGGTAMTDDSAFTAGTTSVTPMAALFDNVSPDSVDEGDAGIVRMSANRNLFVNIRDAAGNERGLNVDASGNIGVTDSGSSLTVDGTVAVSALSAGLPTGANTIGAVVGTGTFAVQETGGGFVSVVNSTNTPLGIGGVFTGTSEDITNYSTASVTVFTNQPSATNGLSIQQSSDGTNWDNVDVFTIPASLGKSFGIQCSAQFFRVVYTNGASAQATFRLQTVFRRFSQRAEAARPQDARENENDFDEVLSYQMGFNGTTWDRLRSDTTNGLDVDVTSTITDNAPFTDGTSKIFVSGYIFDNVAGTALTENDAAAARITANRAQVNTIEDGVTRGRYATVTAANAIKVDGSGVTQPVSFTTGGLPTGANTIGAVNGTIAHGTADSTNPHKIGAKAIAHGTNPTAVAAAARTDLYANRAGVLFTMGGHPNIQCIRANYTTAQTNTALVTIATGLKIVVTRCSVTVANSTTVDVAARVGFGLTNTPTAAGTVLSHPGIAKGSGMVEGNGSGILGVGADNEDLRVTCTVPTSGSVDVVVSYFTIES